MLPYIHGVYLFAACWLLAYVEIQIEGPHGWAEKLPTWRWAPAWWLKLTNGKPLTGYHASLISFLVVIVHFPLLFTGWNLAVEAKILGTFALLTCVWDFQWFVWNPAWGPKRFFSERVWWLPVRVVGLPLEYYSAIGASLGLVAVLDPISTAAWARTVATCVVLSVLSAAVAASRR